MEKIYLAAGCFWGAEHYLKLIRGIISTQVGFANGFTQNPSYKEVYTDKTGYAECVEVIYDPSILSLETLIQLYFKAIDPTSLNKQGEDEGTRYRTGVYYLDKKDEPVIRKVFDSIQDKYDKPICVELEPLKNFFPAEEYHQDYLERNPSGYCHLPQALFDFARNANKNEHQA